MVALPSTGLDWELVYGYNPLGIRKGIITNILMRDYHGSLTNLADPAVGLNADGVFTPFALDGKYRTDLLSVSFPGGQFFDLGALKETGTKISSNTTVDKTMIAQSRRPQRFDLTEEADEINFTAREATPTIDFLRFDKPLIAVPDTGTFSYAVRKPAEGDLVERQIIALAEDGDFRFAYVFPRVARSKMGDTSLNKKDVDELDLTYGAILCPFAMYPVSIAREGAGWRAQAGAPVFPAPAPVATATSPQSATIAFTVPTQLHEPAPDTLVYTVQKAPSPFTTFSSATLTTTVLVGSTVTLTVTGVTTGTSFQFKVTATAVSGLSGTSLNSNSVTGIA